MDINIDFDYFPTNNAKTLGISDTSHYHLSTIINPNLTIEIPGYRLPVIVKFQPNRINILNSNNLAITNVQSSIDLDQIPDGLYKIRYTGTISGTEYSVEKSLFRTELIKDKFERAICKLNLNTCDSDNPNISKLQQIQFLIYSAVANANRCDLDKAIAQYQTANKQLDKFLNC